MDTEQVGGPADDFLVAHLQLDAGVMVLAGRSDAEPSFSLEKPCKPVLIAWTVPSHELGGKGSLRRLDRRLAWGHLRAGQRAIDLRPPCRAEIWPQDTHPADGGCALDRHHEYRPMAVHAPAFCADDTSLQQTGRAPHDIVIGHREADQRSAGRRGNRPKERALTFEESGQPSKIRRLHPADVCTNRGAVSIPSSAAAWLEDRLPEPGDRAVSRLDTEHLRRLGRKGEAIGTIDVTTECRHMAALA
ncbi:MAG: hypothetical protein E6H94_07355 [Chloroflexi bacterium]|nr:MAG: hypothetical protein E6H94_07355 [Chloroflexota bacterium]